MGKIKRVKAREVLDSRGNPTVEVDVMTNDAWGRAIVPSGASKGRHEALELRDKDVNRFFGKGVKKAVNNVNTKISNKLVGLDIHDQDLIDETLIKLDGTPNKSKLGANAILGVSMAVVRAAAMTDDRNLYEHLAAHLKRKPTLPIPFANIINGGKHAGNSLSIQEFMIAPVKAKSFFDAARMIAETYHALRIVIRKKYGKSAANVGDEGGFAPPLKTSGEALELITKAVEKEGYEKQIKIAIDAAASEFYRQGKYKIAEGWMLDNAKLSNYYHKLASDYDIVSIEDPFEQDDFDAWENFTKKAGIQVVGDDLLVTNTERIRMAAKKKLCNALLLKLNQIGTLKESIEAAKLAKRNKWNVMVSHRSGETEDPFIADLSVALACGQIKLGAPCRGERTAKYNQLIRIEEELGKKAVYAKFK